MDEEERIDRAVEAGKRAKETAEFLQSLTKNDEILRPIYNPEAWVMRDKLASAAHRGELTKTGCRHPLAELRQFIDDDPSQKRDGRPTNLFECSQCHMIVWFVDPWGAPLGDA